MIIHIKIYGRVQGVGFRAWAIRQATSLNLSGWVRNRIGGQVEILAEGSNPETDAFLKLCRRGSLFSRVDRIEPVSIPDGPIIPIQNGIFTSIGTV